MFNVLHHLYSHFRLYSSSFRFPERLALQKIYQEVLKYTNVILKSFFPHFFPEAFVAWEVKHLDLFTTWGFRFCGLFHVMLVYVGYMYIYIYISPFQDVWAMWISLVLIVKPFKLPFLAIKLPSFSERWGWFVDIFSRQGSWKPFAAATSQAVWGFGQPTGVEQRNIHDGETSGIVKRSSWFLRYLRLHHGYRVSTWAMGHGEPMLGKKHVVSGHYHEQRALPEHTSISAVSSLAMFEYGRVYSFITISDPFYPILNTKKYPLPFLARKEDKRFSTPFLRLWRNGRYCFCITTGGMCCFSCHLARLHGQKSPIFWWFESHP